MPGAEVFFALSGNFIGTEILHGLKLWDVLYYTYVMTGPITDTGADCGSA